MKMQHGVRKIITFHAVLILLVLSSCMPQKKAVAEKTLVDGVRMEVDRTRMKSEQYVVQGDFKSALDVYDEDCSKYPHDQALITNYRKTIEDINHAASEAFSREDFASSGRAYYVLMKNNSNCQEFFRELLPDKEFLHAQLEDCSSHLSQRALAEYRKGNLAEAISIWKSMLAFNPNSAGILKAIDTATIQLKNLQQKNE